METLTVKIDRTVESSAIGKRVERGHVSNVIKPGTVIKSDSGESLIIFGRLEKKQNQIKAVLPRVKYQNNARLSRQHVKSENIRSSDISFGFKPKRPVFGLPASACHLNGEEPKLYSSLMDLGVNLQNLYEIWSPKIYSRQTELMHQIGDQWKIPGTFFTQGIINDTVGLDYHYDRGNIVGCWSCMAVFLRDISGGELVIPALNLSLGIEDDTFVMFDGQSLLHGVAPIKKTSKFGRRFSIVYYAIEAMKNCGTYDEELKKMRQIDLRKHRKNASVAQ